MRHIQYGNTKIVYSVKKTNRKKTIALQVRPDLQVVILAPPFLKDEFIKQAVLKRAPWIIEKKHMLKQIHSAMPKKEFVSGESFLYLGRQYRLKVVRSDAEKADLCRLANGRFLVEVVSGISKRAAVAVVRNKLAEWYRERAEVKIRERVRAYTALTGKEPKEILLGHQEKRWGSCSRSGVLRFNWRIIMTPVSVMDYVVVHELCHLAHSDHSEKFWSMVASIMPDYKQKREWLRNNNVLLPGYVS